MQSLKAFRAEKDRFFERHHQSPLTPIQKQHFKRRTQMNTPLHITDAEFENKVLQSTTPVVVDFWAPWCIPCKMIAPVLEKLAAEYGDKLIIAKVNTDENPEWAMKYGVQGIPTLLFIKES
jgi:thioredoxin 1